jgi:hypothetical protein
MASAPDGVQIIQRTGQRANRSAKQSIALDAEPLRYTRPEIFFRGRIWTRFDAGCPRRPQRPIC